ncbi:hypothetical protein [uncultured Sphingomonas sp.]|uniref:hypothetical protein n=1 Tax=uncultured Sphingomonas sp. TaxID=158754 RepID=UPI002621FB33|nr:hypothetical protein [uncultured Sphingomonas sp.]
MRKLKLFYRDIEVGTLPAPDNFRPPITQAELDGIPAMLIARSRSWLLDIRPSDLRLELRGDEIVVIASDKLGPGDIGCLVGFEHSAEGAFCTPDESMISLAGDVLRANGGDR